MVFNPYVVPALFSLVVKLVILYLSRHARVQNAQTRLFAAATVLSIGMSVAEASFLLRLLPNELDLGATAYYATSILFTALVVHLAFSVGVDRWTSRRFLPFYGLLYGCALILEMLLLFTPWLVAGFSDLNGYTVTRIPGPLYGYYEMFMLSCLALGVFVPLYGLRRARSGVLRARCKLWLVSALPLCLLAAGVIVLLHFDIRWFNATVTAPLLITLLLAGIGYALHSRRVIEPDYLLPWSRTHKLKNRMYRRMKVLEHELPRSASVRVALLHLSEVLGCPAALIGDKGVAAVAGNWLRLPAALPRTALRQLERLTLATEIGDIELALSERMRSEGIAAVMPFFPRSKTTRYWLVLGEPLNAALHTPLDIEMLENVLSTVGARLLDDLVLTDIAVRSGESGRHPPKSELGAKIKSVAGEPTGLDGTGPQSDKTLEESVAELEARIIASTLKRCRGNQAKAASVLGIRPNTFHYKLKRYGLHNVRKGD